MDSHVVGELVGPLVVYTDRATAAAAATVHSARWRDARPDAARGVLPSDALVGLGCKRSPSVSPVHCRFSRDGGTIPGAAAAARVAERDRGCARWCTAGSASRSTGGRRRERRAGCIPRRPPGDSSARCSHRDWCDEQDENHRGRRGYGGGCRTACRRKHAEDGNDDNVARDRLGRERPRRDRAGAGCGGAPRPRRAFDRRGGGGAARRSSRWWRWSSAAAPRDPEFSPPSSADRAARLCCIGTTTSHAPSLPTSVQRLTLADLILPWERQRLITMVQRLTERAVATGRTRSRSRRRKIGRV